METIAVCINGVIVYSVVVTNMRLIIMQAHQLRKIFCIDELNRNEIDASVWIENGGEMREVKSVSMEDDNILTVGSRMNDSDFTPETAYYDNDFFTTKNTNDETDS